jgi:hypothetical protein
MSIAEPGGVLLAFCIQNATRIRQIVICSLSGSTKFSTLSHKRHDFRKEVIEHTCVDFLYKICLIYFSF